MNDLVRYMLKQTQDEDEKVALEACEFWMALAEQQECIQVLGPFLNHLIPVLINGMRYSETDVMALRGDEVSWRNFIFYFVGDFLSTSIYIF